MLSAAVNKKSDSIKRNKEENIFLIIKCQGSGQHQDELNNKQLSDITEDPCSSVSFCPKTGPLLYFKIGCSSSQCHIPTQQCLPAMPKADVLLTPEHRELTSKGNGQISQGQPDEIMLRERDMVLHSQASPIPP